MKRKADAGGNYRINRLNRRGNGETIFRIGSFTDINAIGERSEWVEKYRP